MSIAGDNGAHALNSVKDGKQNTGNIVISSYDSSLELLREISWFFY